MCWQIGCGISEQQLACLGADLCCATGSSNHWEAAVAGRRKTLRGGGDQAASLRDVRDRSHCFPPVFLLLLICLLPRLLPSLQATGWDAPDRVTVELTRKAAGMNPITAIRPILAPG